MNTTFKDNVCNEMMFLGRNSCLVCQTNLGGAVTVRRSSENYKIDGTPQSPDAVNWFVSEFCNYCYYCKVN